MGVTKGEFHWYSNGAEEVMLHVSDPVPNGFIRGRAAAVKKKIELKVRQIVDSRTPNEIEELRQKTLAGINKLSPEQRALNNQRAQEAARKAKENMPDERRAKIKKIHQNIGKNIAKNRTKESWENAAIKYRETVKNRTPEKKQEVHDKGVAAWARLTPEERAVRLKKQGDGVRRAFSSMTAEDKRLIQDKIYETKKINGTLNFRGTSKDENKYYEYLLTLFSAEDIIRWYKDPRYPFSCDFYVKSIDLFIECNFFWTHNTHPFNANDPADMAELKRMKIHAETSDFYRAAIYTWTDLDVRKQQIAKENNLNYRTVYDVNEPLF